MPKMSSKAISRQEQASAHMQLDFGKIEKDTQSPRPRTDSGRYLYRFLYTRLKKAKERTSAGISLFNFSHCKAMVQN
jgi:hypothetical protein